MKPTWRDYATILMAFAAVFLCGYGVGHLVGERRTAPSWELETLQSLEKSVELRPEQRELVKAELARTAEAIRASHDAVLLDYHRHLDELYGRLIEILDEEQADRLRREKKSLESRIESLQRE